VIISDRVCDPSNTDWFGLSERRTSAMPCNTFGTEQGGKLQRTPFTFTFSRRLAEFAVSPVLDEAEVSAPHSVSCRVVNSRDSSHYCSCPESLTRNHEANFDQYAILKTVAVV